MSTGVALAVEAGEEEGGGPARLPRLRSRRAATYRPERPRPCRRTHERPIRIRPLGVTCDAAAPKRALHTLSLVPQRCPAADRCEGELVPRR